MNDKKQVQQGDIWFEETKIPKDAIEIKDKKDGVFAYGEGHHVHIAADPSAVKFFVYNSKNYARFTKRMKVRHDNVNGSEGEHIGLEMLSTDYEYGNIVEMDHFAKLQRKVVD